MLARSDRVRRRCAEADSVAATTQPLVATHKDVRNALASLRASLGDCQKQFQTGHAAFGPDSLRAWAPHRLARLGDAVHRYRLVAQPLLH